MIFFYLGVVVVGGLVGFLAWLVARVIITRREDERMARLEREAFLRRRRAGKVYYVDFSGRHLPPAA
jgi:uncharacterized membrane protein YqiK